ncbi:MAG: ATP synthase F1 subunit gamma [Alphaproteobacteria bacterium]|nr:ATP synthase F1 subunit gamma [Alphaproteobacteria bacterium]
MAGLKELRTHLSAVKSTKKMTTAMKLVAAAKLKKASSAIEINKPYAMLIEHAVARVLLEYQKEKIKNPKVRHILPAVFQTKQNPQNYLLIVFSSERGLCGSYNQNVAKAAARRLRDLTGQGKSVSLVCYGKKAYDILKKNHKDKIIFHEPSFASGGIFYDEAVQMFDKLKAFISDGHTDVCEIVCSHSLSALHADISSIQVFPLLKEDIVVDDGLDHVGSAYFDYKDSQEDILQKASEKLVFNRIYEAMLSAQVAEQSARMAAMENATDNAKKMIEELTLKYNTLRQSAITTELTEIISGAEAI